MPELFEKKNFKFFSLPILNLLVGSLIGDECLQKKKLEFVIRLNRSSLDYFCLDVPRALVIEHRIKQETNFEKKISMRERERENVFDWINC